jgi:hypothetical protein
MKISELMDGLLEMKKQYGDIPVCFLNSDNENGESDEDIENIKYQWTGNIQMWNGENRSIPECIILS